MMPLPMRSQFETKNQQQDYTEYPQSSVGYGAVIMLTEQSGYLQNNKILQQYGLTCILSSPGNKMSIPLFLW